MYWTAFSLPANNKKIASYTHVSRNYEADNDVSGIDRLKISGRMESRGQPQARHISDTEMVDSCAHTEQLHPEAAGLIGPTRWYLPQVAMRSAHTSTRTARGKLNTHSPVVFTKASGPTWNLTRCRGIRLALEKAARILRGHECPW